MKKLMLFVMVLAGISCTTQAQKEKVPIKVKSAFEQKFPDVKKASWDKENDQEWEAEFKMNGTEYSANFDLEGNWKETEHEIKKSDIPEAVKKTLDTEFAGFEIEEAEISETAEGMTYEFELEKGEKSFEVAISPEGKVLKKEVEEGEEDDDKD